MTTTTTQNITYFRYYADKVNSIVHRKQEKPSWTLFNNRNHYYKGLEIICKKKWRQVNLKYL